MYDHHDAHAVNSLIEKPVEDVAAGAGGEGCASVMLALAGSSAVASVLVIFGLDVLFLWPLWPMVWAITLSIAALVGLPLYFSASATNRATAPMAAIGGFVAGALFPAIRAMAAAKRASKPMSITAGRR
jgi:hypothetical protein